MIRRSLDPSPDEPEHRTGRSIEPVDVVCDEQHGPDRSAGGEQLEHGDGDQERIAGSALAEPERSSQRTALKLAERVDLAEQRTQQAVEPCVRQTGFGLNARRRENRDRTVFGSAASDVEQHRLADPGLTAKEQRSAVPSEVVESADDDSELDRSVRVRVRRSWTALVRLVGRLGGQHAVELRA